MIEVKKDGRKIKGEKIKNSKQYRSNRLFGDCCCDKKQLAQEIILPEVLKQSILKWLRDIKVFWVPATT